MLDEVELCFHPEYQRTFLFNLIDYIKRLKLNNTCAYNIIIATHSPFILSDIPNENILYLKEGRTVNNKISTSPFGANIHDILHQSFFLENGFIGEFAQYKIDNDVIRLILDKEKNKEMLSKEEYDHCLSIINLIGEPLIKDKLLSMVYKVSEDQLRKKQLSNQIKCLKKELFDLENKQ